MSSKAKDLAQSFAAGRLSRRDFLRGMTALGVSAAAADFLVNAATTEALAQGYDWKKSAGKTVNLLLNKHPYTDAMVANLDNFKSMTGMDVKYDVFPEDVYFDKVTAALSSRSAQYDAFMTGAYQTWQYGPAGWLVDLNEFIKNPAMTAPNYNFEDILPNLRAATAWSGVPGAELGGPGAKQWAIPWGFELNSVAYNRRVFDQMKMEPPKNLGDLREKAARISKDMAGQMYGVGVRGSRSWATIHPGYLSGYTNFGAKDFVTSGGKLKAAMNSAGSQGLHPRMGGDDPGSGAEELVHLHLVRGRQRPLRRRLRHDLRRRHPGLLHERDGEGEGQHRLHRLHPEPAGQGPDPERLDLVARHVELLPPEGGRLGLHAVGERRGARPVRRAEDGLR